MVRVGFRLYKSVHSGYRGLERMPSQRLPARVVDTDRSGA